MCVWGDSVKYLILCSFVGSMRSQAYRWARYRRTAGIVYAHAGIKKRANRSTP